MGKHVQRIDAARATILAIGAGNYKPGFLYYATDAPFGFAYGLPNGNLSPWMESPLRVINMTTAGSSQTVALVDGETLTYMVAKAPSPATINVGSSAGGSQIVDSETLPANKHYTINVNYSSNGSETLYLSGFPTGTAIKIYILI